MAIAISEAVADIQSTANTSSYPFSAFTPTANALLVVFIYADNTAAAGTMSGGSLTWIKLGSGQVYNSTDKAYIFYAQVPASPSSTTIAFDCTGDNATGCVGVAFSITGHNPAVPIAQFKFDAANLNANPDFALDRPMNTLNGYCAGFGINRTSPASTPPGSWTEIADTGHSSPNAGGTGAYREGGETGTTVAFTAASGNWGGTFVEINEASIGNPPPRQLGRMQSVDRASRL